MVISLLYIVLKGKKMKELIANLKREIMGKGIVEVLKECADKVRLMQTGGQELEEHMARLEYQVVLALAAN